VEVVASVSNEELQVLQSNNVEDTSKDLSVPIYNEGSDSSFVLVCINPQRLMIPIAMSGQHKLCLLKLFSSYSKGIVPRKIFIPAQQQLKKIQHVN